MRSALGFARRTPCLVLLVVQLLGVLLYPPMGSTSPGRAAFALFGLLVLALTVVTRLVALRGQRAVRSRAEDRHRDG